jgi:hypothetical protein
MPSSRSSATRLALMVDASGVPVNEPCVYCRRRDLVCVRSSLSKRCSACLRLNQGCSSVNVSLSDLCLNPPSSRIAREVLVRSILDFHLSRVRRCLALLSRISDSNDDLSDFAGEISRLGRGNVSSSLVPMCFRLLHILPI